MKILQIISFIIILGSITFAQQGNTKIGADMNQYRQPQAAFYDYSDPEALNIKVAVWGAVKFPGYYLIPNYIATRDLMSYAGGPTDAAQLDDLRLYRVTDDSNRVMIKFNYNDLLWEDNLTSDKETIPNIQPGDIVVVPGEPRYYFRDTLSMTLSVVSAVTSVAILIVSILRD